MTRKLHPSTKLSEKQEQALAALLAHPTVRGAAASLGISERTMWDWLTKERFKAAYEEQRQLLVSEVRNGFLALARTALEGIADLVDEEETPAAVKLKAYLSILDRIAPVESAPSPAQASSPLPAEMLSHMTEDELTTIEAIFARAQARKDAHHERTINGTPPTEKTSTR